MEGLTEASVEELQIHMQELGINVLAHPALALFLTVINANVASLIHGRL